MRLENTIEHILPQTPTDEYGTSRFDEEERRTLTHDLGNLCLTYHNSSYGNKPLPAKRGYRDKTDRAMPSQTCSRSASSPFSTIGMSKP